MNALAYLPTVPSCAAMMLDPSTAAVSLDISLMWMVHPVMVSVWFTFCMYTRERAITNTVLTRRDTQKIVNVFGNVLLIGNWNIFVYIYCVSPTIPFCLSCTFTTVCQTL